MRKLVGLGVMMVLLFALGCSERQTRDVVSPGGGGDTPDETLDDGGVKGRFYNNANAYAIRAVAKVTQEARVVDAIARFEGMGYSHRPENGIVFNFTNEDGREAEMVCLSLANVEDENRDAIHLFCSMDGGRRVITPIRVSSESRGSDAVEYRAENGAWIEVLDPIVDVPPGLVDAGLAPSAKDYWRCVAARISGSALNCLYTCRFALPTYWQCVAGCSVVVTISAMIGCLWFYN